MAPKEERSKRSWIPRRKKREDRAVDPGGEVATLRVTLHLQDQQREADQQQLLRHFSDLRDQMYLELQDAVWARLDEGFLVSQPVIREGSIEFLAVVTTVARAVIDYGALRTGIDYLLGDFAGIVVRHAPPQIPYVLVPTLIPGPLMTVIGPSSAATDEQVLLRHVLTVNLILLIALTAVLAASLSAALK